MKKLSTIILSFLLLLQCIIPIQASVPTLPDLTCQEVIIMDVDTKQLVYSKDPYKKIAPASITKIMTLIVALESGVSLDTQVTIDTSLFKDIGKNDAQLNFSDGETFTLRDMLYCTAVFSANDAAITVAQCVGGSVENFVNMMNQKANELGCENTHFVTANGLDADDHFSTPYDLCLIMSHGIQNELFNTMLSTMNYIMPPTKVREAFNVYNASNPSINPYSEYYIQGIVSSKVGYTDKARACEISYISKDGRRFLVATFGGSGDEYRASEQFNLAKYFFDEYTKIDVKQDYSKPILQLPYIYEVKNKKDDYYTIDNLPTMYAFNNAEVNKVSRTFVPIPLGTDAKEGDLAGHYVYKQNGQVIHLQEVRLTSSIDIGLSLNHIGILILVSILSFILYVILVLLIVGILNRRAKRKAMRRR